MRIVCTKRSNEDWHACFENDSRKWAHGRTAAEAIGNLALTFFGDENLRTQYTLTIQPRQQDRDEIFAAAAQRLMNKSA